MLKHIHTHTYMYMYIYIHIFHLVFKSNLKWIMIFNIRILYFAQKMNSLNTCKGYLHIRRSHHTYRQRHHQNAPLSAPENLDTLK